jgi:hypothetical protein
MEVSAKEVYRDNLIDRLCTGLFAFKMANAIGRRIKFTDYEGLVDLSKHMMQGRNAEEQKQVVLTVLRSLIPAPVLRLVRSLFSPTKLVCELNAWFATWMFEWLVGASEVKMVEVPDENGKLRWQKSGVYIKKCRYLESSNCVGMCINMCKLPTQEFFTQDFGIPLTMIPNFEDYSCEMVFGQVPPAIVDEAVYHQPCLMTRCETASSKAIACPRLR